MFSATTVLCCCALLCIVGSANGEARFLSHVPYDEEREYPNKFDEDYDYDDIHDSIVKLPGRHYRKLPYTITTRENSANIQRQTHRAPPISSSGRRNSYPPSVNSEPRIAPLRTAIQDTGWRHPVQSTADDHRRYGSNKPANDISRANIIPENNGYFYSQNDEEHPYSKSTLSRKHNLGNSQVETSEEGTIEVAGPRFDRTMARNVTVRVNDTARLSCRVLGLKKEAVSWLRGKDLSILTLSTYRYTTDLRISITNNKDRHEWLLSISKVTQNDAGNYECQISVRPMLSFVVNLLVVESDQGTANTGHDSDDFRKLDSLSEKTADREKAPYAVFSEGPFLHFSRGDVINLTCIVTHPATSPAFVSWLHDNQTLYQNVETYNQRRYPAAYSSAHSSNIDAWSDTEIETSSRNHPINTELRSGGLFQSTDYRDNYNNRGDRRRNRRNRNEQGLYYRKDNRNLLPNSLEEQKTASVVNSDDDYHYRDTNHEHIDVLDPRKTNKVSPLHSDTPEAEGKLETLSEYNLPTTDTDLPVTQTSFLLLVGLATEKRAGKYTCRPHNGREASVTVHVTTVSPLSPYSSGGTRLSSILQVLMFSASLLLCFCRLG